MSISELSSQSTLFTISYLTKISEKSSERESDKYIENMRDHFYICEDWLKQTGVEIKNMVSEIDSKIYENREKQKKTSELYQSIKESMNKEDPIRKPIKRKFAEIEKE